MTWTRISDDFIDRPDLLDLSRDARLLLVESLVYCNKHLTDGRLPKKVLRRITDSAAVEQAVEELSGHGHWGDGGDVWVLDWSDQESRARVLERREQGAERQRRSRARRRATANNSDFVTRDVTQALTPTRPDPTRPKVRGGEGAAASRPGSSGMSPAKWAVGGRCTCVTPAGIADNDCIGCGGTVEAPDSQAV